MIGHILAALTIAAAQADSLVSADSGLAALRKGGFTIIWRHTATDQSNADVPGFPNTPRFQQRNLSDRGVTDAKAIGVILKRLGAPIGDVFTSPMFRTRETAQYAFGRYTDAPLLIAMSASADERAFILAMPAAGTNRVLVTHHFVIERNVPGIKPGDVAEGEAVIAQSNGQVLRPVAIIKMKDWIRLHDEPGANGVAAAPAANQPAPPSNGYGAPPVASGSNAALVIPALLQTEQRAGVAEYLRAFSSGDQARMRAFLERWANPNPERTIQQRVEALKGYMDEMGTLSIVSAEAAGGNQVIVKVLGSKGKPATMTFTVAESSPYRVSVMMQVGGP